RHGGRAREPDAVRQHDREIGADGVEAAVREIDDAAQREDQRQAERDQKVISADQEAVENLLEYEDELHAAISWRVNTSRSISSYYVVSPHSPSENPHKPPYTPNPTSRAGEHWSPLSPGRQN